MQFRPINVDDSEARKAAQMIAYLALKSPQKSFHVVKAVKLVYLADRESIARFGFPILNDKRVSMPHGPVHSNTYRYINGDIETHDSDWSKFLSARADHQISVQPNVTKDDCDELSEADIECLEAVWKKFGQMDEWKIRDWTHQSKNIPEWEDPDGSSIEIPIKRIIQAIGLDNVEEHAEAIEDQGRMKAVFLALRRAP